MDTLEENRPLITACLEAWAQLARSEDLRAEMLLSYEDFRIAIAATARDAFAEIDAPQVDSDSLAVLIIALFDGLLVQWQLDPRGSPGASQLIEAAQGAVVALTNPRQ
jgi:hypothetical protein